MKKKWTKAILTILLCVVLGLLAQCINSLIEEDTSPPTSQNRDAQNGIKSILRNLK